MSHSDASRTFFGGPVTRSVKALLIANGAVYALQLLELVFHTSYLVPFFGLMPARVTGNLMVWQLVTYMFLHGGPLHLFFNMLTLFMFGNDLERYWGTRRFLNYYFLTGVGAGVCSWAVAPTSGVIIIGASGAIYGLLLAYGLLYPNRIVYLNFLIPVKIKYMVLFMGLMAFTSSFTGGEPGVAHLAHLGGMLVGLVYLKGRDYLALYKLHQEQRRRTALHKQFEIYYPELRRRIENEKKKGPTIH